MATITKKSLAEFYREYVNNFLTTERMAEYYEISVEDCTYLIELGKKCHNEIVEMNKINSPVS